MSFRHSGLTCAPGIDMMWQFSEDTRTDTRYCVRTSACEPHFWVRVPCKVRPQDCGSEISNVALWLTPGRCVCCLRCDLSSWSLLCPHKSRFLRSSCAPEMSKRKRSSSVHNDTSVAEEAGSQLPVTTTTQGVVQDQRTKKLKLLESHATTSPFPDYARPLPQEAFEVHNILLAAHPDLVSAPRADPAVSNDAAGTCGSVPNVLESLIGTILSQNTSSKNSTAAKRGLDAAFGRNNFERIVKADTNEVIEAIKTGGLANKKRKLFKTSYER